LEPSWKESSWPQQYAAPAVVTAQVWLSPAAMAVTPLVRPLTATGMVDPMLVVPMPSSPSPL
jgi:hypothetical protein